MSWYKNDLTLWLDKMGVVESFQVSKNASYIQHNMQPWASGHNMSC